MKNDIKHLEGKLRQSHELEHSSVLNKLARKHMYSDLEKMHEYSQSALQLAVEQNNHNEQGTAYYNIGVYHLLKNDIESCADAYHKAFSLIHADNVITKTRLNMSLGFLYAYLHNFEKSLLYSNRALELASRNNLPIEKCSIYNNIGRVHHNLEEYDIAEYYYQEALNIASVHNQPCHQMFFHMYMASTKMKRYNTEIEKHLLKIESHIEETDDMWYLGPLKILWSVYYVLSEAYDVAKINYTIGFEIMEEEQLDGYLLESYLDLTHALEYQGLDHEAENIYEMALDYFEKRNLQLCLPKIYLAMSKFYSKKGQVTLYQKYLRKYVSSKETIENYLSEFF